MRYKNSFVQIIHKPGATYLKVFPAKDGGKKLTFEEVSVYLNDKKIIEYDVKVVHKALTTAEEVTEVLLIEEEIASIDEYLKLSISADKMLVVGRFYPPSSNGKLLDREEILKQLEKAGVKYGIIEKHIDAYLRGRQFCTSIPLARGTQPVQGKAAEIQYHFSTTINVKPKINEDGSVDFHSLDNINKINKGDLLATLIPADLGKAGKDVWGNEVAPLKVVNKVLKHGKNIHLSPDGLNMYADVSGHVTLTEGRVFVSDTYQVPADVGPSTGDIDYDGNVSIAGNVVSGFTVKATGDVYVDGVVEGATIIAGGQIILRRGIQGMSKGKLVAEGDVVSKFIESSEVTSGANVSTDAIMHSYVSAKGDIVVQGKRGLITGGEVKSGGNITLKTAGSTMGTVTVLSVGIDPVLLEEYRRLEKDVTTHKNEIEKTMQVLNVFQKKIEKKEKLSPEKLQMYNTARAKKKIFEDNLTSILERYTELKEEMDLKDGGKIKVENIAYPGVKIIISNVVYYVNSETHYSQFVKERAEVRIKGL